MTCKGTLGVIAKNAKVAPRFAIRFKDSTALAEFAKAHNLADPTMLGRWRVDGLLPSVGAAGAIGILESQGWQVSELLYFGAQQCFYVRILWQDQPPAIIQSCSEQHPAYSFQGPQCCSSQVARRRIQVKP